MTASSRDWPDNWREIAEGLKQEDYEKALFEAKVDARKKLWDAELAREAQEHEVNTEFYKTVFEVAKGSIDRTRSGAETVQKAAAAIGTIYASLLGLVFSVSERPLPSRGVIAGLFLAVAIVASTAYLAYLTRARPIAALTPRGSSFERELERARTLIEWTRNAAEHRSYLLILALAAAVAFLPAPFVSFDSGGSASTSAESTLPNWPTVSRWAGDNVELQKILYTAQVAEVVEARKAAAPAEAADGGNEDELWWWIALVAAALVLVGPWLLERLFGRAQENSATTAPPRAEEPAT